MTRKMQYLIVFVMSACLGGVAYLNGQSCQTATTSTVAVDESAATESTPRQITVRKFPQQVVLYTLYRGDYANVGEAIGRLFTLAGQKGLMPPKGVLTLAYLNNPQLVTRENWLTEIRIPVRADALQQAGTLGEFTDIKSMPAMEVAVIVKPAGVADPAPLYVALRQWIVENDYCMIDAPMEQMRQRYTGGGYAQTEADIMVPVEKLAPTAP